MILLAVSGGIDSMYLLNRAGDFFPGESFAVAHCNFRLRGVESDGDEAFVKGWCDSHGIKSFTKRFDTADYAVSKGISIEMAARELRYAWFAELCVTEGFRGVAVAHNSNDNAETLILNLLRGTGSRGARGMAECSPLPGTDGKAVILRPLLGIERKDIEDWMRNQGQDWREDRTNSENVYKRNLIRNEVFPLFSKINPSFLRTLGRDMEHLAQTDEIAEEYFAACATEISSATCSGISIDLPALLKRKHWKYILWRLIEPYNFSYETLGKLTDLLEKFKNEPRGTVTLGGKKFESPTNVLIAGSKKLIVS